MKTLLLILLLLPAASFAGPFACFPNGCSPQEQLYQQQLQQQQYQQQQAEQRERQRQFYEQNQIRFNNVTGPNGQHLNCVTIPLGPTYATTNCN
jgi:flagellar basal body-associated protein FliL